MIDMSNIKAFNALKHYIEHGNIFKNSCSGAFLECLSHEQKVEYSAEFFNNRRNVIDMNRMDFSDYSEYLEFLIEKSSETVSVLQVVDKVLEWWDSRKYHTKPENSSFHYMMYQGGKINSAFVLSFDPLSIMLNYYPSKINDNEIIELFNISKELTTNNEYAFRKYYPYQYSTLLEFLKDGNMAYTHHKKNVEGMSRYRMVHARSSVEKLLDYDGDDNIIQRELDKSLSHFKYNIKPIESYKCNHTSHIYVSETYLLRLKLINDNMLSFLNNNNYKWLVEDLVINGENFIRYTTMESWILAWDYVENISLKNTR